MHSNRSSTLIPHLPSSSLAPFAAMPHLWSPRHSRWLPPLATKPSMPHPQGTKKHNIGEVRHRSMLRLSPLPPCSPTAPPSPIAQSYHLPDCCDTFTTFPAPGSFTYAASTEFAKTKRGGEGSKGGCSDNWLGLIRQTNSDLAIIGV